jgi:hypothetical protein
MQRVFEILRVVFDRSFWQEFIDMDMCEEARMMHEYVLPLGDEGEVVV